MSQPAGPDGGVSAKVEPPVAPLLESLVESSEDLAQQIPEAVRHLQQALFSGVPWHQALLEAVGLWTRPQETYQGRKYHYLIHGEALDWLSLAERLCSEMDGVIPEEEKEDLLFLGKLPKDVSEEVFKESIGATKHRAYLNYWYGVTVEEALQLATEEEVRKRYRAKGYPDSEDFVEEAFSHLYDATRTDLIKEFREAFHLNYRQQLALSDLKEFTYWLFKRRLEIWDPARVASDTRKGIRRLEILEEIGVSQPDRAQA
jgi:hypothetical protein